MTALLSIESLSRRFVVGGKNAATRAPRLLHAVDDVSFTIQPGECVGLVGESGCGKSTLVKLITRLIDPSSGRIVFDGRSIGDVPARQFAREPARARIQKVFQDPTDSLNPRFTAFDLIADPLRQIRKLSGSALTDKVVSAADDVALPRALLSRYPHQLSGGQKARVGIARAIAVEPALLVLDEPTAALDVSVQAVILHLLADLRRRLGMAYLFVSHDLNVVRLLCDRVLVMYLGKIVESGPASEVFAAPRHPYTEALVSALPHPPITRAGGDATVPSSKPIRLSGEPRSPIDPAPSVCRFFGRCSYENERCQSEMPLLATASGSARLAACHFPRADSATRPTALGHGTETIARPHFSD
jgi:oligopeptide/dipeptide ABC transporter ATP-binding protein